MDFISTEYLKSGNSKQKHVYSTLTQHNILYRLNKYDPIVVGTIPLNIDIKTSDIDIICYWTDKDEFKACITDNFSMHRNFKLTDYADKRNTIVATFSLDDFTFEIFGQNIPTRQQFAYRHMVIEYHILQQHGEKFRLKVIELKQQGYKTEHAFALLLGLKGNPYEELLTLDTEHNPD